MSSSQSSGRRSQNVTNSKRGDESTNKPTTSKRKRGNDDSTNMPNNAKRKFGNDFHKSETTPISPPSPQQTVTEPDGGLVPHRLNFSDEVIKVIIEKNDKDGEYILKLKTGYNENNAIEEHEKTAALLLSQAAMLRGLGEILLSKIQTQHEPQFIKSFNMKYQIE